MTDSMTHRGPNDRGTHLAPGIALGARRLSIVDVADGHQPFSNEDGRVWGAQNGELYNHATIREELRADGHRLATRCDTEILPHLYERDGTAFVERLRGKFGLAVWDDERRRAVIARDRLGVKPLYYAITGDLLVFGSELKSVLASGLIAPSLDYEAIDAYLTLGFFPGVFTPLAGVRKLLPGHFIAAGADGVRLERYWEHPKPAIDRPRLSTDQYADGLIAGLEESVRLRLMSDVPLGAMLSGGLDSSLIVALMARNMPDPVKTFSVGFVESGSENELADARHVAEVFGTEHHELELSYRDAAIELDELIWYLDEPLADLSALGFLALSKLASEHVTVALSGQGADELLGGYRKHRVVSALGTLNRLPAPLTRAGVALGRHGPPAMRRVAATFAAEGPVERLLAMSGLVDDALRAQLVRGSLTPARGGAARAIRALVNGTPDDPLPSTLHIDAQLALPDDMLHYFDRASMAHSLEVRVPFLDHELVEYCARIPGDLKVRRLKTKYLLKVAARGIVPDRIVDKRKIGFFRGTVDGWLRAQLDGAVADHLLQDNPRYAEFLEPRAVRRLVEEARAGSGTHRQLLLSILMLEVWLSTYLPRALPGQALPPERVAAEV